MDRSSFIGGMLVGGIATAGAFQLVPRTTDTPAQGPAVADAPASLAASGASDDPSSTAGAVSADYKTPTAAGDTPMPEGSRTSSAQGVRPGRDARSPAAETPDELPRPVNARSWPPGSAERAREPQDPGWSHYMEQAITTYVAKHRRTAELPGFAVECRSSCCELPGLVVSDDSWLA